MQGGSCEAWASEQGLARAEWNLGAAWARRASDHVQANKLLMLAALWERPCRFGLICAHQASTPTYLKQTYQTKPAERKTPPLAAGTDSASPRTPSCRCPWPGGVFGQQTESQKMWAWPPRLNPIKSLEITSHFLALILLANLFRIDDQKTM